MELKPLLQQFAEAAGLSLLFIQEGEKRCHFHPGIRDHHLADDIYDSLPEDLPHIWTSMAPEDFLLGGLSVPEQKSSIVIAPVFAYDCSVAQSRSILNRLGVSLEETARFQTQMNYLHHYDLQKLKKILLFLNTLCNHAPAEEIQNVVFHWKKRPRRDLPIVVEVSQNEAPVQVEDVILNMIRYGKREELVRFFNETLFAHNNPYGEAVENLNQLRRFMIGANMYMSRVAVAEGVSLDLINEIVDTYGSRIERISSSADFNHIFLEFSLHYMRLIDELHAFSTDSYLANQINRYVQSHLYEKVTLASIAEALSYSKTYLCAEFKKAAGITVSQFIAQTKIREASYLLEQHSLSEAEISEALGFSDVSYFIKVFRKITGKTPGEFQTKNFINDKRNGI